MNELIKVTESNGNQAVSARDLYLFLTDDIMMSNVNAWMTRNILNNKFASENIDYQIIRYSNEMGRGQLDYALTMRLNRWDMDAIP